MAGTFWITKSDSETDSHEIFVFAEKAFSFLLVYMTYTSSQDYFSGF